MIHIKLSEDNIWIYYSYTSFMDISGLAFEPETECLSIYGLKSNIPEYLIKDNKKYKIISNHLGSPVMVLGGQTQDLPVLQMKYDSFGNIIEQNGEVSDSIVNPVQYPKPASLHFDLPFGFAGGLWDKDTKLVRFGVRDYDAETGRWTSKEPLGFAGARNFYVYAGNDGVNYVDLDGLLPDWFIFNSDFWEELGHHSVASLIGIGDGVTGGWIPGIDYSTTEFIRNKISFLMGSEYECKQIAGEYKKEKAYTAGLFLSFFINLKSKAMFERTKDFFKKFKKYNGYWKPENGRIVPNRKGF